MKNGLANARAKGKHIGRKKTRPSELIRALLKSGMTYRGAAAVAQVSHGSIHAEKMAMLREEREGVSSVGAQSKVQETSPEVKSDEAMPFISMTPEAAFSKSMVVSPLTSIR